MHWFTPWESRLPFFPPIQLCYFNGTSSLQNLWTQKWTIPSHTQHALASHILEAINELFCHLDIHCCPVLLLPNCSISQKTVFTSNLSSQLFSFYLASSAPHRSLSHQSYWQFPCWWISSGLHLNFLAISPDVFIFLAQFPPFVLRTLSPGFGCFLFPYFPDLCCLLTYSFSYWSLQGQSPWTISVYCIHPLPRWTHPFLYLWRPPC